jgi:hypothetical protein
MSRMINCFGRQIRLNCESEQARGHYLCQMKKELFFKTCSRLVASHKLCAETQSDWECQRT